MNFQQDKNFNIENTKVADNITNYSLSYSPQLSQNSINNSIPISHTSLNKKKNQEIKKFFNSQIYYNAFVKHTSQNQKDFSLVEAKRFKITVDQQIEDQLQKLFDKLQEDLEMNDFILGDDYLFNTQDSNSLHIKLMKIKQQIEKCNEKMVLGIITQKEQNQYQDNLEQFKTLLEIQQQIFYKDFKTNYP